MRTSSTVLAVAAALALAACGPARTTVVRYPGSPVAFDRAGTDPKALEIADKAFAAAGGPGNWDKLKQLRWDESVTDGSKPPIVGEAAWDRWNAREYGRVTQPDGDVVVGYDLYTPQAMGFMQNGRKHQVMDVDNRTHAVKIARDRLEIDSVLLALPFLMLEPGTKLAYVGPAKVDPAGADTLDEITVTFADPRRSGHEVHAFIDRTTNLLQRVEFKKPGETAFTGYALTNWTDSHGLKFAATRTNLGAPTEITTISNIRVSDPEDDLFIAPL